MTTSEPSPFGEQYEAARNESLDKADREPVIQVPRVFSPDAPEIQDLPPNDECPPDLSDEAWEFILFLTTPPDLRDLEWNKKMERARVQTTEEYCRQTGINTKKITRWYKNPWFKHYLALAKAHYASTDVMVASALEQLYIKGKNGNESAMKSWLHYATDVMKAEHFGEAENAKHKPGDSLQDMSIEELEQMRAEA